MTADELALVDTNILIYTASPGAPQHETSRALLESGSAELCVTSQILAEFYSVVTNPRRVTAPFTPKQAVDFIHEILSVTRVLPLPAGTVTRWVDLAERYGIRGADIFDLQLLATMLEHGIRRIYTFNRADFERFPDVEILTP